MNELKTILFAEDDPHDVELTLAALEEHNLANKVQVVRDGAEALDYLFREGEFAGRANGYPIVVLLDLRMPKISGVEVLRQLKAHAQLRTIPVVVLTSSRDDPELRRCYELGVNAFVRKPVNFAEFAKTVKALGIFWAAINQPPRNS